MYKDNQKGIAQLFLVAAFAFAVLSLSGVVFYKTVKSSDNVRGYSISQLTKPNSPATNMPCTKDMMVCSTTTKRCCSGYILRGCTTFNGVAKDRPFEATKGTVCVKSSGGTVVKDLSGVGLGICSRNSRCSVSTQAVCCSGFEASTEGCTTEGAKRCLPKDTDKDGIPDLWDDDADGDGIVKKDDTDDDGDGIPDVDTTTGRSRGFPVDPRVNFVPVRPLPVGGEKTLPKEPTTLPDPVLD
jgi:hypothetical protein